MEEDPKIFEKIDQKEIKIQENPQIQQQQIPKPKIQKPKIQIKPNKKMY